MNKSKQVTKPALPQTSLIKALSSVAGFTLLSRATGFIRDVMMGALLGTGPVADAFVVAFRLPNQFRTIFGEGAFSSAYVPAYSAVLARDGLPAATKFAGQILTLLFASQIILLALALIFTKDFVLLLAPGFDTRTDVLALAVTYTRITFPYLLCMTLVTLHSGTLNAHHRFAASSGAPILLNLCMIAALFCGQMFTTLGEALSWGVTISGVLQLALVFGDAARHKIAERPQWPQLTNPVRQFFRALGPAILGSAGSQIAIFADTIIASFLPAGSVAALYYADRLYQLPLGILGIAAGTVLLPQMSRLLAEGEDAKANQAQNRTLALLLLLSAPFVIGFLTISPQIMRGVFLRGAFDEGAVTTSASVLTAYGFGLLPMVLLRAVVSSFQARGDTKTPMQIFLVALIFNLALKITLTPIYGIAGLAFGTALGAWLNFGGLVVLGLRRKLMQPDETLGKIAGLVLVVSVVSALGVLVSAGKVHALAANITRALPIIPHFLGAPFVALAILGILLAFIYGAGIGFVLPKLRLAYPLWREPVKNGEPS